MNGNGLGRDRFHTPIATRLRSLHEITMELSRTSNVGSLCRGAVELCISRLGFDRIGIWFLDPKDPRVMVGTWGTDEEGRPRDESGIRLPCDIEKQPRELYDGSVPFVIVPGNVVYDSLRKPVGRSDKAIALLWDGAKIAGELVADNLLTGRAIDEEDGELLVLFARTVAHLCALKRSETALKDALEAKAILLGEFQHRTVNSFALMKSLISIEAGRAGDSELGDTLRKLRDRVSVLTSLYRQLDLSEGFERVRLDEYLRKLAIDLLESYGAETLGVLLECRTEPIEIDMKRAVSIGLILNELITDSLKHAFPGGRRGIVALSLRRGAGDAGESAASVYLSISDDGIGLPEGFNLHSSKGLGITIVDMLCHQISGALEIRPGPGAFFSLRFEA